jgi:hypothetical protein
LSAFAKEQLEKNGGLPEFISSTTVTKAAIRKS